MGRDLAIFLREMVGGPVYVSGNSSGGLLAITIGLEASDLVRGLVLEDPPLFSSVHPRFPTTAGYPHGDRADGALSARQRPRRLPSPPPSAQTCPARSNIAANASSVTIGMR